MNNVLRGLALGGVIALTSGSVALAATTTHAAKAKQAPVKPGMKNMLSAKPTANMMSAKKTPAANLVAKTVVGKPSAGNMLKKP